MNREYILCPKPRPAPTLIFCFAVKVWDNDWYLKMVFVGHTKAISVLSVYPDGPAIISASHDSTVRVWNLDSCDEVDR